MKDLVFRVEEKDEGDWGLGIIYFFAFHDNLKSYFRARPVHMGQNRALIDPGPVYGDYCATNLGTRGCRLH